MRITGRDKNRARASTPTPEGSDSKQSKMRLTSQRQSRAAKTPPSRTRTHRELLLYDNGSPSKFRTASTEQHPAETPYHSSLRKGTLIKKLVPAALLFALATAAYAQPEVYLDNVYAGTSTNSNATTNGLFWIQTNGTAAVLINKDFNAAFYGGTNATNLSIISTFLLSNGTATGDNASGSGTFSDPTGMGRIVSGASSSAFFRIQAWTGNSTNYTQAVAAGAYCAQSAAFSNSVASPPNVPPDLTGMPAIVLVVGGSGNSPSGFSGGPSSSGGTPPSGPSG